MKHHYLVCYDIANNKRRYHVDRCLAQYGERIQLSVYDIVLNTWQLDSLRTQLRAIIAADEDRIHYYPLSQSSRQNTQLIGAAFLAEPNTFTCICQ